MRGKFFSKPPEWWGCLIVGILVTVMAAAVMVSLADKIVSVIIILCCILFAFVLAAIERVLCQGRYIAGRDKLSFLRYMKRHDFKYSDIADVTLDIVLTHCRYSTIAYAKIILELKNGQKFDCTDRLENDDSSSMNELNGLLKEHQFARLKDYIMERIQGV